MLTAHFSGIQGKILTPSYSHHEAVTAAEKEQRCRCRSAFLESGLEPPIKMPFLDGDSATDLAVALIALENRGEIPTSNILALGELSLNGNVRPVRGILPMVQAAKKYGVAQVILPISSFNEASNVEGIEMIPVETLQDAIRYAKGEAPKAEYLAYARAAGGLASKIDSAQPDMADIYGMEYAKFALEVAAAGGLNVLFVGVPGAGKTMLARRLTTILPDMTEEESLETTAIYSVAGLLPERAKRIQNRPFRAPHHTISDIGLVGGGKPVRPGEMALAHNGVLFLDELPEFRRQTLDQIPATMKGSAVHFVRQGSNISYPANFQLVAAMNACPCGYFGSSRKVCKCTANQQIKYWDRIDRLRGVFDLIIPIEGITPPHKNEFRAETSAQIKERVQAARRRAQEREGNPLPFSADCIPALHTLRMQIQTPQVIDRFLKVAGVLADLRGDSELSARHLNEAQRLMMT